MTPVTVVEEYQVELRTPAVSDSRKQCYRVIESEYSHITVNNCSCFQLARLTMHASLTQLTTD